MKRLNALADDPAFKTTALYRELRERPLGFVDVGAAGGVHPLILPLAGLTDCLCFEANQDSCEGIRFATRPSDFHRLTVCDTAIGDREGEADFYLTRSLVNSSLLRPNFAFLRRYGGAGFAIDRTVRARLSTLDRVTREASAITAYPAEIVKLDCQGVESRILRGARETLSGQCLVLWCEVEFCDLYEGQETFAEVDRLVRGHGFSLYGLSPNYISGRRLDRVREDTNERLLWADALYLRDPLDPVHEGSPPLTWRQTGVLVLAAMALGYLDLAIELAETMRDDPVQVGILIDMARREALERARAVEANLDELVRACANDPDRRFARARKFIDANKGNNNLDFLRLD